MADVEHFEANYPPPCPPEKSPTEIFHPKDYRDIDNRARQAPADLVNDFDKLLTYLLKGANSDLAKVRSIFVWLSAQQVVTSNFPKVVKPTIPQAWLKKIKYDRNYFAELFALLCRKAGVPCAIIEGCSKGGGFEVGQEASWEVTSRWNAVHVQGSWQLVHVAWALISTDGVAEGEWVKVEEDGRAVREVEVAAKEVRQELDEFWFLTSPEDFSAFCHPKDERWQLLESPWTDEEFLNTPRYDEEMFSSSWELITENKGVLVARQGACKIAFVHRTQGVNYASLTYNLYFNTHQSPKPLPDQLQLDRYVLVDSKRGEKSLVTRLPQAGVYRVQVAGILDDTLTSLSEFRIECPDVKQQPPPFPEGCREIGYTEKTAALGLEHPTQEEGIVVAKPGERLLFSFGFAKDRPRPQHLRATVTHSTMASDQLDKLAQVQCTNDDVTISVQFPKDKANEIGVCVDAQTSSEEVGDNQSIEVCYRNVINYIVTKDEKLAFPEEKAVMKTNSDMLESIKNFDATRIHQILATMGDKLSPLMRTKLDTCMKEVNKLKHGQLRELVQAMNGSDINQLEKALADYEKLRDVRQETVKQARASLDLLRAMKTDDNVDGLEKALRSVYDVKLVRNCNIQRAEDILVTYYEKELDEAYYKRTLDTVNTALAMVDKSCVVELVKGQFMFSRAVELLQHLKEMKQVTDKIGHLKTKELKKISGVRGKEPHPHVRSVLMATFILLGEREAELWKWEVIQNLLERRSEQGVARAMADLDIASVTLKQVDLAEGHVRTCQLDLLTSEDPNTAFFLQWVNGMVKEKRGREAVKHHHTQIKNTN